MIIPSISSSLFQAGWNDPSSLNIFFADLQFCYNFPFILSTFNIPFLAVQHVVSNLNYHVFSEKHGPPSTYLLVIWMRFYQHEFPANWHTELRGMVLGLSEKYNNVPPIKLNKYLENKYLPSQSLISILSGSCGSDWASPDFGYLWNWQYFGEIILLMFF